MYGVRVLAGVSSWLTCHIFVAKMGKRWIIHGKVAKFTHFLVEKDYRNRLF